MEGCVSCGTVAGVQDLELERIKTQAKNYAEENKTSIAICKDENGYAFFTAEFAIKNNYRIIEVVSKYNGAAAE